MFDEITSASNPRIKNILALQSSSKERKMQQKFIIEGYREIDRALRSGFVVKELYVYKEIDKLNHARSISSKYDIPIEISINDKVFNKIAYREGSDGLIAITEFKSKDLQHLYLPENPLVLVIQSVEKPGNIGAIMRTADAAGVDAVIICDAKTDIFNPNIIRSSLGCIFSVAVAESTTEETLAFLQSKAIKIYSAALTPDAIEYTSINYKGASAIIMGSEAFGLSNEWLKHATHNIVIPMRGIADSLNVSTSTAILVFEALRQRASY